MTRVFITRTGEKYHAISNCPSFEDLAVQRGRPIHAWETDLRGLHQDPCTVCWPETSAWDQWTQLAHRVERRGDSDYEVAFVQRVLRLVPGLQASDVAPQRKAHGKSGSVYYLDFVVEPLGGRQVAIEIDGYEKTPEKSEDRIRAEVESKRADLRAAGWRVLNFSNTQVTTRTVECVGELRSELSSVSVPRHDESETQSTSPSAAEALARSTARPEARGPRIVIGSVVVAAVLVAAGGAWWLLRSTDDGPARPVGGECPAAAPVKGNVSQNGERIYHEPGWRYYAATDPEECFRTSEDARGAGYRESEVR